jgi:predicted transcriptional regulator
MQKIQTLLELLDARVFAGNMERNLPQYAFGSDLMSDVLTLDSQDILLITGLSNPQTIRTAEMADINTIIIARGKQITNEMIEIAKESDITLISSPYSLFKICGILYNAGLKAIY